MPMQMMIACVRSWFHGRTLQEPVKDSSSAFQAPAVSKLTHFNYEVRSESIALFLQVLNQ